MINTDNDREYRGESIVPPYERGITRIMKSYTGKLKLDVITTDEPRWLSLMADQPRWVSSMPDQPCRIPSISDVIVRREHIDDDSEKD